MTRNSLFCIFNPPQTEFLSTALQAAFDNSGVLDPKDLRLVWIKNTQELEYLWASESTLDEAKGNPNLEVASGMKDVSFDAAGNMVIDWPPRWGD